MKDDHRSTHLGVRPRLPSDRQSVRERLSSSSKAGLARIGNIATDDVAQMLADGYTLSPGELASERRSTFVRWHMRSNTSFDFEKGLSAEHRAGREASKTFRWSMDGPLLDAG